MSSFVLQPWTLLRCRTGSGLIRRGRLSRLLLSTGEQALLASCLALLSGFIGSVSGAAEPERALLGSSHSAAHVRTPAQFRFTQVAGDSTAPPIDAEAALRKSATWRWPDVSIFAEQLASFLEQSDASEETRGVVDEYWDSTQSDDRGPALLERLLTAAAFLEPRVGDLHHRLLDLQQSAVSPTDLPWLTSDVPGWLQDTVRLACGRAFAQRRMYDEALETLAGLEVQQVCDPASLIFYRAVAEHHLLKKEACLTNVQMLLEREDELPNRFAMVAKLMEADIEPLKTDSLDEVARMMRDVERRLDLGRAGTKVRDEEQRIVDKLDKLIEDIEQQLQQQQAQSQSQQQNGQPSQGQAMEDSQIAGGSGPGDVDQKDVGDRSGWGNLPPAQRQQALQRLTEELPSHYRDVIEGYFRQLAK